MSDGSSIFRYLMYGPRDPITETENGSMEAINTLRFVSVIVGPLAHPLTRRLDP